MSFLLRRQVLEQRGDRVHELRFPEDLSGRCERLYGLSGREVLWMSQLFKFNGNWLELYDRGRMHRKLLLGWCGDCATSNEY
jgi:hypothetical protein